MQGYKPIKDRLANENSRVREAIFLHKLAYDLKVAGVAEGAHLQIYKAEVDEAGVDITVEWGHGFRKFQLKTVGADSSTRRWSVHPALLKPTATMEAEHQVVEWQYAHPFGLDGGVILTEVEWNGDAPKVRYSCTDFVILMMLRDGIIGKPCAHAKMALARIYGTEGSSRSRVNLSRNCFVRAASPVALLELMRMPIRATMRWQQQFFRIYGHKERRSPGPPREAAIGLIRERFGTLAAPAAKHMWRE